ncbi:MAG: hypothetical protein ABI560_12570 [Myxococcales bacterium]
MSLVALVVESLARDTARSSPIVSASALAGTTSRDSTTPAAVSRGAARRICPASGTPAAAPGGTARRICPVCPTHRCACHGSSAGAFPG